MTLKLGSFVKHAGPGGSIGKVVGTRTDGPFVNDPGLLVEWVYGLDKRGDLVKARSMIYGSSKDELILIVQSEYDWMCQQRFNA